MATSEARATGEAIATGEPKAMVTGGELIAEAEAVMAEAVMAIDLF